MRTPPPPGTPGMKMARSGTVEKPRPQGNDLRLADHRHRLELEVLQGFADGQSCLDQVTLNATATAIGDLMLGKRREEASGRPTFLVGLFGELDPHLFDGGQAQVGEQQIDARSVDRVAALAFVAHVARARGACRPQSEPPPAGRRRRFFLPFLFYEWRRWSARAALVRSAAPGERGEVRGLRQPRAQSAALTVWGA